MFSPTINNLTQDLKPRQREILVGRFGLEDGEKKTLASLGEKYSITRERVRQIESEALEMVQSRISKEKGLLGKILTLTLGHLKNLGGFRRDNLLIDELKTILNDENLHHWHLRFLSETVGQPFYYPTDQNFHDFWYLDKKSIRVVNRFISKLEKLIINKKEDLIVRKKFDVYFNKVVKMYNIPDFIGLNYISLSRKFDVNSFGDLGLYDWEEINPKTIRSKAYLIIKKYGQPMHFREISNRINENKFDKKVGLVRIKTFRPFPKKEIEKILKKFKILSVWMDEKKSYYE